MLLVSWEPNASVIKIPLCVIELEMGIRKSLSVLSAEVDLGVMEAWVMTNQ